MTNQYCTSVIAMPRIDFRGLKLSRVSFSLHFFKTEAAAESLVASPTSLELSSERTSSQPSQVPTMAPGTPLGPELGSQGVPTTKTPVTVPSTVAETPGSTPALTSDPATSKHPSVSGTTTALHKGSDSPKVRMQLWDRGLWDHEETELAPQIPKNSLMPALYFVWFGFYLPAHHVPQCQRSE